jgi:hypothetical protein
MLKLKDEVENFFVKGGKIYGVVTNERTADILTTTEFISLEV